MEINKFVTELVHLQEAEELLREVYIHLDPYKDEINGQKTHGTVKKICDHFGFDDNE